MKSEPSTQLIVVVHYGAGAAREAAPAGPAAAEVFVDSPEGARRAARTAKRWARESCRAVGAPAPAAGGDEPAGSYCLRAQASIGTPRRGMPLLVLVSDWGGPPVGAEVHALEASAGAARGDADTPAGVRQRYAPLQAAARAALKHELGAGALAGYHVHTLPARLAYCPPLPRHVYYLVTRSERREGARLARLYPQVERRQAYAQARRWRRAARRAAGTEHVEDAGVAVLQIALPARAASAAKLVLLLRQNQRGACVALRAYPAGTPAASRRARRKAGALGERWHAEIEARGNAERESVDVFEARQAAPRSGRAAAGRRPAGRTTGGGDSPDLAPPGAPAHSALQTLGERVSAQAARMAALALIAESEYGTDPGSVATLIAAIKTLAAPEHLARSDVRLVLADALTHPHPGVCQAAFQALHGGVCPPQPGIAIGAGPPRGISVISPVLAALLTGRYGDPA